MEIIRRCIDKEVSMSDFHNEDTASWDARQIREGAEAAAKPGAAEVSPENQR